MDSVTPEFYSLSLHDALPIYRRGARRRNDHRHAVHPVRGSVGLRAHRQGPPPRAGAAGGRCRVRLVAVAVAMVLAPGAADRKSTRLNSSHLGISYAVFCLKKK